MVVLAGGVFLLLASAGQRRSDVGGSMGKLMLVDQLIPKCPKYDEAGLLLNQHIYLFSNLFINFSQSMACISLTGPGYFLSSGGYVTLRRLAVKTKTKSHCYWYFYGYFDGVSSLPFKFASALEKNNT